MIYKILLFFTISSQTVFGQSPTRLNNDAIFFVNSLLNKESYKVEFLDFQYPRDIQEILTRFQNSLATKKEWAEDYVSKYYKPGEGLPYHENFGITKDEYLKIKNLDKSPPTLIVKDTSSIKIKRTSDFVLFNAIKQDTKFFESLKIDLKNKIIIFITDTIPFLDQINASSLNAYGNVQGYTWKKDVSNLGDKENLKTDSLISKVIEINFGKISTSGKILLTLKYEEVNKGQIKGNFQMACFLD